MRDEIARTMCNWDSLDGEVASYYGRADEILALLKERVEKVEICIPSSAKDGNRDLWQARRAGYEDCRQAILEVLQ